jgi:hypothetical protein
MITTNDAKNSLDPLLRDIDDTKQRSSAALAAATTATARWTREAEIAELEMVQRTHDQAFNAA